MKPRASIKIGVSILTFGILILFGCKKKEIAGIIIGETLLVHQDLEQNQKLIDAIKKSINKDEEGIIELANFECGGGAGCYDLGFVLSQIVYKIGEDEFLKMVPLRTYEGIF